MESKARNLAPAKITTAPHRVRYVRCIKGEDDPLSLTRGQYYAVLPDPAESHGMIRVIDNTTEDYLFPATLFQIIDDAKNTQTELTVNLSVPEKVAIHQIANQRGISMAALMRKWIDERLDLASTSENS